MALAIGATAATQTRTAPEPMTGGGEVTTRLEGDHLDVSVRGPAQGFPHLCVGDSSQVRILHASAALGEAVYQKTGDTWRLTSGFEWALRDSRQASPTSAEEEAFFTRTGWLSKASWRGDPVRHFRVKRTAAVQHLAVAFLATETMNVSHWPGTVNDSCREVKVVQGHLPETARFEPAAWSRIQ